MDKSADAPMSSPAKTTLQRASMMFHPRDRTSTASSVTQSSAIIPGVLQFTPGRSPFSVSPTISLIEATPLRTQLSQNSLIAPPAAAPVIRHSGSWTPRSTPLPVKPSACSGNGPLQAVPVFPTFSPPRMVAKEHRVLSLPPSSC